MPSSAPWNRSAPVATPTVLSAGSDGIDGNSPAAGAVIDDTTCKRARLERLSPEQALANFDAFALFQQLGDALTTDPTGNNLRDLRLILQLQPTGTIKPAVQQSTAAPMPLTEADILHALRDCYDPILPCNIVDLGMVASIQVEQDPNAPGATIPGVPPRHRVAVALTPASHDEAANAQLSAQIANRLAGMEPVFRTTVTLLDTPTWSPARITPAGRRTLGLDGNPSLIQIAPAPL